MAPEARVRAARDRNVLRRPIKPPRGVGRPGRRRRLGMVLSRGEVRSVLRMLAGEKRLVARLPYGSGRRLMEALALRTKDVDPRRGDVVVRGGKGGHDRVTILPRSLRDTLVRHVTEVRAQQAPDITGGAERGAFPRSLARKMPDARHRAGLQNEVPASHSQDLQQPKLRTVSRGGQLLNSLFRPHIVPECVKAAMRMADHGLPLTQSKRPSSAFERPSDLRTRRGRCDHTGARRDRCPLQQ
jgi:integrase